MKQPPSTPAAASSSNPVSGVVLRLNANEVIPDGGKNIPWDEAVETWGTHGADMWAVGNPTRLLSPVGGYYRLASSALWADAVGVRRFISGVKNGEGFFTGFGEATPGTQASSQIPAIVRHMAAGDYIEIASYQNSGGNLNMLADSGSSGMWTWATWELILAD